VQFFDLFRGHLLQGEVALAIEVLSLVRKEHKKKCHAKVLYDFSQQDDILSANEVRAQRDISVHVLHVDALYRVLQHYIG
jgi:hypothetical protein